MPLSDYDNLLTSAVNSKAHWADTKSEFLERFGSTRKAAEYLHDLGIVRNRQGEPVKVESLMRRFQTRGGKSQGETSPVYREAGRTLPPSIPGGSLPITIKGEQDMGDGSTRTRVFTYTFRGSEAQAFAQNPSYRAFFYKKGYDDDLIDRFEDGTYKLTVTSVS